MKKVLMLLLVSVIVASFGVAYACDWCDPEWTVGDGELFYELTLSGGYEKNCTHIDCAEIRVAAAVDQWAYMKLKNTDVFFKINKPGPVGPELVIEGCVVSNGQLAIDVKGFDGLRLRENGVEIDMMGCWYSWDNVNFVPGFQFNDTAPVITLEYGLGLFNIYMKFDVENDQTPGLYFDPEDGVSQGIVHAKNEICFTYTDCNINLNNPWI
ncbi:hypothetical protein [Atribacter laminatus]|uniref:Uncharacterized protein n=1 Tax=Atribacter laminatus TaxID=2847778 RepID=A0A7T1AP16_ATRLM|nr:hypothetical protein [Atribacter laminatus]QPM69449.1 hypothetical protein RT761_02682 [Atribacter laminatus]